MIVARPLTNDEPCLLEGNRLKDLYLYDLDGKLIVRQNAPYDGWCYDSVESISESLVSSNHELSNGWEAYLDDKRYANWIGSSEL